MLFLYEKKISDKKRLDLALQECYGLGFFNSLRIFSKTGFNKKTKLSSLSPFLFKQVIKNVNRVILYTFGLSVELYKKKSLILDLKKLQNLRSYKSIRHVLFLPVRGQRSKNNSQTQKRKNPNYKKIIIPKKKK